MLGKKKKSEGPCLEVLKTQPRRDVHSRGEEMGLGPSGAPGFGFQLLLTSWDLGQCRSLIFLLCRLGFKVNKPLWVYGEDEVRGWVGKYVVNRRMLYKQAPNPGLLLILTL